MNRLLTFSVSTALLLTGCGGKSNPVPSESPKAISYAAPIDCKTTSILSALPKDIPNPAFIDTSWQPAAGTELADVLNNGGIACSYGNQSAEIGVTIYWVNNKGFYEKRIPDWLQKGYQKVDLANLDEESAYLLFKPVSSTQEFHIWSLNFLYGGVWIQVNGTFINDLTQAEPIISATVASLSKR
jgi:hypothetical protein